MEEVVAFGVEWGKRGGDVVIGGDWGEGGGLVEEKMSSVMVWMVHWS